MSSEEFDAYIRELVASWPPFTPEQRDGLRALFRAAPVPAPMPQRDAA